MLQAEALLTTTVLKVVMLPAEMPQVVPPPAELAEVPVTTIATLPMVDREALEAIPMPTAARLTPILTAAPLTPMLAEAPPTLMLPAALVEMELATAGVERALAMVGVERALVLELVLELVRVQARRMVGLVASRDVLESKHHLVALGAEYNFLHQELMGGAKENQQGPDEIEDCIAVLRLDLA
jgi:hypothetical protein